MNEHITWSPGVTLEAIEKQVIQKAFQHFRGNKTATSIALGISIRTLDNKFERYEADAKAEEIRSGNDKASRERQLARARGIAIPDTDQSSPEPLSYPRTPSNGIKQGQRMESVANAPAQQTVPMPKPQEIQSMLPAKAPAGGYKGSRR